MNGNEDLLERLGRSLERVPVPEPDLTPVRRRARTLRARRYASVALVSALVVAGIALPLKAMLPLGDRDKPSVRPASDVPQVHGTVYLSTHDIRVFHEKKNGWPAGTSLPLDKTACDPLLQAMGGASITVHDGEAGPVLATLDVGAPTLDPVSATLPEGTHLDGWDALGPTKSRKAACWATAPFQGPIPKSPDGRYTFFIEGVDEAKTMGNFFARSGYHISYADLAAQGFQLALGGGDAFDKAWQALVAKRAGKSGSAQPPSGTAESAQSVSGTVHIDRDFTGGKKLDTPCTPDNIKQGSKVSVKDGGGNLIATGTVTSDAGVIVQEKNDWYLDCSVPFTVPEVPITESYSFQVEDMSSTFHFSKAQMESLGWEITLYEKT